jgi:hypothetical protein
MDYKSMNELEEDNEEKDGVTKGRLQNWRGEGLKYKGDGLWEATGGHNHQFRLEIWSPFNEDPNQRRRARWLNVEITAYCRVEDKHGNPDYAWQLYSRGGHHTTKRGNKQNEGGPCEGSALKARWYNKKDDDDDDKENNRVTKEVCHPFYSQDDPKERNPDVEDHGDGKWYGAKLLVYNIDKGGNTLTKMEVWTDSKDEKNDWKKVMEHVDEGDWEVPNSREIDGKEVTFKELCGDCDKKRDEILTDPGGDRRKKIKNKDDDEVDNPNYNRNCVALRTDEETIQFKSFSCREIDPSKRILD